MSQRVTCSKRLMLFSWLVITSYSIHYTKLYDRQVAEGLKAAADRHGIPLAINHVGGMFGFFFSQENSISRFEQVTRCDMAAFKRFYHLMLDEGVYLAPSAYEAGFLSMAHGEAEIAHTLAAADRSFARLSTEG